MTISSLTNKNLYIGNGTQTSFAYTWLAAASNWVNVKTGSSTDLDDLTLTTDYTLTNIGGGEAGGYVILVNALATNSVIVVSRIPPYTQSTDYVENDPFGAETHEAALDKLTAIVQTLDENIDRSLLLPASWTGSSITFPQPSASALLGWNSAATEIENKEPIDSDTLTSTFSYATVCVTQATAAGSSGTAASGFATAAASSATAAVNAYNIPRVVILKVFPETDILVTGNAAMSFVVPSELNTMSLVSVGAHVYTTSSSGKVGAIAIYNASQSVDMLSTNLYIDQAEKDSSTCTTTAVVSTTYHVVTAGNEIQVDVDGIGTNAKGLEVRMGFASS